MSAELLVPLMKFLWFFQKLQKKRALNCFALGLHWLEALPQASLVFVVTSVMTEASENLAESKSLCHLLHLILKRPNAISLNKTRYPEKLSFGFA